jgi:hypothetical protein
MRGTSRADTFVMRVTGFDIFRIAVWVLIAVWVNPKLLDWIHAAGVGRWLLDHGWVRLLGALPLVLLGFISILEQIDHPQKLAAGRALAEATGSTLVKLRFDPTFGIPDGPGLRVPLGVRSMVVGTWKREGDARTVATAHVETRSAFSFLARGPEREPALVHAVRSHLSGLPITTGVDAVDHEVVLRANQADAARALFTTPAVTSALSTLNGNTRRWEMSLCLAEPAGTAELRLECPGTLRDADRVRAVQALMKAVLEGMAGLGAVAA